MLFSKFPHVAQRVMLESVTASISLAEKFELVASDAKGAIALLTPDDMVVDRIKGQGQTLTRARQNVVVEIGWIWGKLGRKRCLLLSHGAIELPSRGLMFTRLGLLRRSALKLSVALLVSLNLVLRPESVFAA